MPFFPYPFRTTQLAYRRIHGREDAESQGAIEALHVFKKRNPTGFMIFRMSDVLGHSPVLYRFLETDEISMSMVRL